MKTKQKPKFSQLIEKVKNYKFIHISMYVMLAAVIFVSLYSNVKPETIDVELFTYSDQTIIAPTQADDTYETDNKRQEAYDAVEDEYVLRKDYVVNRVEVITSIFDFVKETNKEAADEIKLQNENVTEGEEAYSISADEKLKRLKDKLTSDIREKIPDDAFRALLDSSDNELAIAKDSIITAVNRVMSDEIPLQKQDEAKDLVEEDLKSSTLRADLSNAAVQLGRYAVIANYVFDLDATEEKKQQAYDDVKEVQIKQGQILVEEGGYISRDIYRKLDLVGLLDNQLALKPFAGLMLIILLIIATLIYYFEAPDKPSERKNHSLILYVLIFSITILLIKIISFFQEIDYSNVGYLVPVAMGAMLIKLLLHERLAILTSIIFAVCGSIIFNEGVTGTFNFTIGVYFLFGSIAGVLFLNEQNVRSRILQTGLFVALINILIITSILLMQNGSYSNIELGSYFIMALASGLVSSVLTIGFMPFFETGFGILSTMKLIELSNPNHPLLRKILTETPGTYHHSVMVANLSEAACEAIGANGLLARVGAYYHDIGKTKRPQYFIENQMNIENPHDKLSPQLSKNVIISHVSDGAELLRRHKMPKEFVDIAEQHHGTTLLKFFYHKAKQNHPDIYEEEFRYPGPKPQTKEIAIISIADSVEAAVRSMSSPTPDKIEKLIRGIITDRLQDHQLNECDLTLRELDIIAKSFSETLKGIFHSRIEYPEISKQKVKQA
ncbi:MULTISPECIES: HD family phosphohydrolase [Metabacillus]|uniref:HD family phosphohydrolase n=1 Tax=Metabacillus hrfriensis TaxID=3048891 RepID=A0ACD4R8W9_9BACI|nr:MULTISPECIES: HD family phosphohydrolase [Metabacillus]UAL51077.1 HD family phosphohydrolase [Metabacillus dongyingensis]USK27357.1 HD family phosphohydrolase [Bacillus sp. CMF21]WHZ56582.1 HD family phosphohydrolase [Metabacillus sp. CT-WN-B3]